MSQLGAPGNTAKQYATLFYSPTKLAELKRGRIVVQSILGKVFKTRVVHRGKVRGHPKSNKEGMTKEMSPRYETRTEKEGEENEGACVDHLLSGT